MRFSRVIDFGLVVFFGSLLIFPLLLIFPFSSDIPASLIVFTLFFSSILLLLIYRFVHSLREESSDSIALKLEKMGDLTSTVFKARRAFLVDEFEDEGIHYFIELEDKSILFLSGQYLYDYEPTYFRKPNARKFPCTNFTVRRHRTENYVIDIICGGEPLEPEFSAAPFDQKDFVEDTVPQDGEILTDRSYDQLKKERSEAAKRRS